MCLGFPVMYNKDVDRYVIDLSNVVVATIRYDISDKVANYDYFCKTNNITAANVDWVHLVVNTTLASKVVREVLLTIGVTLPFGRAFPPSTPPSSPICINYLLSFTSPHISNYTPYSSPNHLLYYIISFITLFLTL